jgi:hypothetical protein
MLQFRFLGHTTLPLQPQLQWLLYAPKTDAFLVGDEKAAFAVSAPNPGSPAALKPAREGGAGHACNLPIPEELYDEVRGEDWHGFRFLTCTDYDSAKDDRGHAVGDLLRTLAFGPDYGLYVIHPSSGSVLGLRGGSIQLLERAESGFKEIDRTKTRGRAALAFATHPAETLLAYGDNYGTFHAHRFDATGFGKASKVAAKERKASRVEFVGDGKMLVIGGMGYLATYSHDGRKFSALHEISIPVRDFIWAGDGTLVLVNQGMHGVSAYRYDPSGFAKFAEMKPGTVQQMAVSKDLKHLAVTMQDSGGISLYTIERGLK